MEKHTLNIYGTTVKVYKFLQSDEGTNVNINLNGQSYTPSNILNNKAFVAASRTVNSYYARGNMEDKTVVILANGVDQKQLSNLFLSLGVVTADASVNDITQITITEVENGVTVNVSSVESGILSERISAESVSGVSLGGEVMTADTIKAEDIFPKKDKKKRRK